MRVTMEKERIALGNPQDQEQEYRDPVLDLGEGRYLFTCQVCGWAWLGTTKPRRCTRIVKGRHATWWIPRPWLVRGADRYGHWDPDPMPSCDRDPRILEHMAACYRQYTNRRVRQEAVANAKA